MNCKFHPTAEAVATCGICGVGMCKECSAGAFAGTVDEEKPVCLECCLKEIETKVILRKSYLDTMKFKNIFASIFIGLSVLFIVLMNIFEKRFSVYITLAIVFWFLSGLIQTWKHEKDKGSIKSIFWEDSNDDGGSFFWKIVFYVFAGPVMLIKNFIEYPKLKAEQKSDMQKYEEIKTALGNAN